MATVSLWSDVAVAMQSALATAITITGVTNASPGVVSHAGADPSDGDYILITSTGMSEIDGRVFRVDNQASGTFELEGEDTTSFGTFSSGSFQVITMGTTVNTVTDLSSSGGDFGFEDTTTIHQNVATQIPTTANAATFTFTNLWDVSDAGLVAMKAASDAKTQRAFMFTFANGMIMAFNGYVGASLLPGGSAQGKVTTSTVITMYGSPTYYTS
ncbi:MAG: phage tail protein [Gammaproteobacteria bacterium]|nr:phage tail protein [Gammaproteobacteria bacterium]